jgi:hypothetical protein
MSEWELRLQSGARGYPVNHDQFQRFRKWGLIPEPDGDGRWPAEVLDRLIEIRSHPLRQLPRRVLALRENYLHFPVPPDKIRQAAAATVPGIDAPVRKFKRIDAAINWWAQWQNTQNQWNQLGPMQPAIKAPQARQPNAWPPAPTEWIDILSAEWVKQGNPGQKPWEQWADIPYRQDALIRSMREVLGQDSRGANIISPYFSIPFEERIVLLMVRWAAMHKQFFEQRQAQPPAQPEHSQQPQYAEP